MFTRIAALLAACVTALHILTAPASASPYGLRCLIDTWAARPEIPGVSLEVRGLGVRFREAAGLFAENGRRLRPTDAFRTASVTKSITAATLLRLAEQRKVRLDAPVSTYLDMAKVPNGADMTVRQLLDHTAGLYDYVTDPAWREAVIADPQRTWTPDELLEWGLTRGRPYFKPGEGYHYSDTGYILAGRVIEKVYGKALHHAYRDLVFRPLGMRDTYLEHWERPRAPRPLSHAYFGEIDTRDWNPTFDTFGGGGLVSTSADLTRFARGLFEGRLFGHADTLPTMLKATPQSGGRYSLGLVKTRLGGEEAWGHSGFFGAFFLYVPAQGLSIAGTVNQSDADQGELVTQAYGHVAGTLSCPR
ncbi:serine hydrolase domain-containing protein [Sinosporangium siamense]|uniref:Serine hydrolase n=1 Tax=Sinosporangium siamense TaxID=1367973 RepID=A0A919RGQ5_9ACTN|nr:serine hydrolase domain-containing protein [Sinosporangium siamense]GII92069.1 serine hydrolase [Sinosporangium siamense]